MESFYVYLCYGNSPSIQRELFYALGTLKREIDGGSRIMIFTDHPEVYRGRVGHVEDISLTLNAMTNGRRHKFRVKPVVLARALHLSQAPCVLLDTDSFVRPGFDVAVGKALAEGAAMNAFVRRDPYPDIVGFTTTLPRLGPYAYSSESSLMLNSGLVAARYEHVGVIEDAVVLMDRLNAAGLDQRYHDVEQFAIAECFRIAGVPVRLIDREFEHYCQRWSKKYMRRRLREYDFDAASPTPNIPLCKTRVRAFKFSWSVRLALRAMRGKS